MIRRILSSLSRLAPRWELSFTLAVVILAVAIPTAGLLFFMNRALEGERLRLLSSLEGERQKSLDGAVAAARGLLQEKLRKIPLATTKSSPHERFVAALEATGADACLILDARGAVVFPILTKPDHHLPLTGQDDRAQTAIEKADKEVLLCGHPPDLTDLLKMADLFARPKMRSASATTGRLHYPNYLLAALQQMPPDHPRRPELLRALTETVAQSESALPTSQRHFLAAELAALGAPVTIPHAREELFSLQMAHAQATPFEPGVLSPLPACPGHFALRLAQEQVVVFLDRSALLASLTDAATAALTSLDLAARLGPHGGWEAGDAAPLAVRPLSSLLPGWEIAAFGSDATAGVARSISRLKILYLVSAVGGCLLIGSLASWAIRRFALRARLTQVKQDFLSIVSHELKTPLTSIRMFVDSLADGGLEEPERARTYLHYIRGENERLSRLVENFLTFSRLESGRMNFDFHLVHPADIQESVVAAIAGRLTDPQSQFQAHATQDLPLVRADADSLVTALLNLVDNAIKYSGENKHIVFSVTSRDGRVEFSVTDNGVGMRPETAARLGEKFFRERQNHGQGGFGLGLSIVRAILVAHDGDLGVASTPGLGSRFTISLPARAPDA